MSSFSPLSGNLPLLFLLTEGQLQIQTAAWKWICYQTEFLQQWRFTSVGILISSLHESYMQSSLPIVSLSLHFCFSGWIIPSHEYNHDLLLKSIKMCTTYVLVIHVHVFGIHFPLAALNYRVVWTSISMSITWILHILYQNERQDGSYA